MENRCNPLFGTVKSQHYAERVQDVWLTRLVNLSGVRTRSELDSLLDGRHMDASGLCGLTSHESTGVRQSGEAGQE
jgi:hypothetical protein